MTPIIFKDDMQTAVLKEHFNNSLVKFSKLKVIVIESPSGVKSFMRKNLQEIGFTLGNITVIQSPSNAENICRRSSFDIYIINMNIEDTERATELVHKLYDDGLIPTKSVMGIMTSDNSRSTVLSTIEKKPEEYIIKPFNTRQLKIRLYRAYLKKFELSDIFDAIEKEDYQAIVDACFKHLGSPSIYTHDIRIMLAEALVKQERLEEAELAIREGLNFADVLAYHIELGKILLSSGKYEDAAQEFNYAIKANPLVIESYRWLSELYIRTNDLASAQEIMNQAIKMSPHSSSLLHTQLLFAMKTMDYSTIKDNFNRLLELHRYDPNKLSQLLAGFVQAEIMYVSSAPDTQNIDKLAKHVNAVLTQCEPYMKLSKGKFDYNTFKDFSRARIDLAISDNPKARKLFYKTLSAMGNDLLNQSEAMLSNVILGLWQIGDYEHAEDLFNYADRDKFDPLIVSCIDCYKKDPKINEKREKYQELNKQGIKYYKQEKYDLALEMFVEALKKSPSNSNATINKAQALLKLASSGELDKNKKDLYLRECANTLSTLDNIYLGKSLTQRVNSIKEEIEKLLG